MASKMTAAVVLGCLLAVGGAGDNLDYWLDRAKPVTTAPATSQPASAPSEQPTPLPADAAPGAIELSDGRVLAGHLATTPDQPWMVYVEPERRWRAIPPLAVLSIQAVVDEERTEAEWRWAGMGQPERVYTGRQYPFRRYRWTFRLIDGTQVTGTVKGQPLWLIHSGRKAGPWVLHERDKGPVGTTLCELVYVRRVVISRRAMGRAASQPTSQSSP